VRRRGLPTAHTPLPGGHLRDLETYISDEIWPKARALGLDREQADHLGSIYGSMTPSVLERVDRDPSLAHKVCADSPTIAAQVEHAVQSEWAMSLGDVMLRRTSLGLQACQGLDCLDTVVDCVAALLGWDRAECDRQIATYHRELEPMRQFSRSAAPV
jgi:glycerol-3-phosphate dehydrogenase